MDNKELKKETITISKSTLQLSDCIVLTNKEKRAPKPILITLMLLSLLSISIPIAVLFILLQLSEGLPLGFFISCIIFIFAFCYFIRMYLWNKYGEEVILINRDTLIVYYNYKYFKDNYKKYHYDTINILVEHNQKMRKVTPQMINSKNQMKEVYVAFGINNEIVKLKNEVNVQIVLKIAEFLKTMSH